VVRMNIKILSAVIAISITMGLCPLRAAGAAASSASCSSTPSAPLPQMETVLKRVIEEVQKEDENEQMFKQGYSFTRIRKREVKSTDGEVKKTEEKTKTNNPVAKRLAAAKKSNVARTTSPKGASMDSQAAGLGKDYEKSDFPINDDLINRYDFTLVGREMLNGRPALVIDFQPGKRKLPERNLKDKFLNKAAGRAWVDEEDSVLVKADLYLTAPVNVLGGGLAWAVQKFTFGFNRQRTAEGIWFTVDSDWHLEDRRAFFRNVTDFHEKTTNVTHVGFPDAQVTVQK